MDSIKTKADARRISAAIEPALQKVAEELGLTVKLLGGRYDPRVGTYAPKVEFAVDGAEDRAFAADAAAMGLPEQFERGTEVTTPHGKYRIVGFRLRASKYPVLGEKVGDGRTYKLPESVLEQVR